MGSSTYHNCVTMAQYFKLFTTKDVNSYKVAFGMPMLSSLWSRYFNHLSGITNSVEGYEMLVYVFDTESTHHCLFGEFSSALETRRPCPYVSSIIYTGNWEVKRSNCFKCPQSVSIWIVQLFHGRICLILRWCQSCSFIITVRRNHRPDKQNQNQMPKKSISHTLLE